ncbi:aspartyl/asparaginyl beta-hydroxylase domain-containing protein [Oscillatoria sp. CS-180]|uniref:aspartyl/asparaginyl beta-hydroxylase domain-containing protein n=1 Tax=Oscillatoria sp. CS-180 TaxID=3021720 RepID=UPI00232D364C|nr:aspartyl/asparaginyl beta-hydroxylase domain-containing protein [Oscillatoria sp. CS-180]MDB9527430.1 aspartyl/asparaginyl beta-hydroxylase domain-containing protein [Oscillatoria sp. CS-180]
MLKTYGFLEQLIGSLAFSVFSLLEWFNKKFSLVGNHCFFELDHFSWVYEVENQFSFIREELDNIINHDNIPNFQDISKGQEALTQDDKWKAFLMYANGHKIEGNCVKCPRTVEALEKIPNIKTAFFSIIYPHKHIPPHRGPFNGILRYHLGLIIPSDRKSCRIRVGDQNRHWEEGKSIIFDDTWNHEAWNDSDQVRVVLFVDFLRPLPFLIKYLNIGFISFIREFPFIRKALRTYALTQASWRVGA